MKKLSTLWKETPAFYLSLLLLIGVGSAFFWPLIFLVLLFQKRLLYLVAVVGFLSVKLFYPTMPEEQTGSAHFHIEEVKRHAGPIRTTFVYSGTIKMEGLRSLPCRIYLPPKQKRHLANTDYFFKEGILRKIGGALYIYKPKSSWEPVEQTTSLAEWRFQQKEKVRRSVRSRFKNKKVATLLTGLATGNIESRFLAFQFNSVGLSHLLAISGFHFALLSFFLAFLLRKVLPERLLALALILLLTAYFFYMGKSPSISRAWIGILIYLVGMVFHFRPRPLNALGVALIAALGFDPLIVLNVGFQLSFGATLGILLFYSPFEEKLRGVFLPRPYPVLLEFTKLDQCSYLFCTYLRKVLALQGAVLTFTLPLILFHFGTFPLASLFYNLFYPLLFSVLLALFLLHLDFLTAPFAAFLLQLIEGAPKRLLFKVGMLEVLVVGVLFCLPRLLRRFEGLPFKKGYKL